MSKLLLGILTSSKIELLRESYRTAVEQEKLKKLKYDIYIIVNTTNDDYYYKVMKEFKNVNIVRTNSNGKPGMGHNSVINFFKYKKEYDYLFMLDGDDFLYSKALQIIENYIYNYNIDLLLLMYHDSLTYNINAINIPHIVINNNCYLQYNFNSITDKQWLKDKGYNPFKYPIYKLNTLGRIILFSRKSLEYNIKYDNNCFLYDDFYPTMQCMELAYKNMNVFRTSNSNIYIYNMMNENSQTNNFKDNMKKEHDELHFRKNIMNKFNIIKDWDLTRIKKIDNNNINYIFEKKYNTVTKIIKNLKLKKKVVENKNNYKLFINFIKAHKLKNFDFIEKYLYK